MSRPGRRWTEPRENQKATVGVRVSPALKRLLVEAAEHSDRSLSAEIEVRLEVSFYGKALQKAERAAPDFGELWLA